MQVTLASLSALSFLLSLGVRGSGVLEVRLHSLHSAGGLTVTGRCCTPPDPGQPPLPCPPPGCRPFARMCLRHFQIDPPSLPVTCTFGSDVTPVLGAWHVGVGRDILDAPYTVRLPFDFPWPKSFSLDIEVWHDNGNRSLKDPGDVIARASVSDHVTASTTWTNQSVLGVTWQLRYGYRITCDAHYYGDACQTLCRPRDDALAHFRCDVNGSHVCLPGWEGEDCNRARCSEACLRNGGSCVQPFVCRCRKGWWGADCEQCETRAGCTHGTCTLPGQCSCRPGWAGSLCNIDVDYCKRYQPCLHGGTCLPDDVSNYTCACHVGWSGSDCRHAACYSDFCLNGGLCVEDHSGARACRCPPGFQGNRCHHALAKCGDVTCINSGSCVHDVNGSRCVCPPGYSGTECHIRDSSCASSPCYNGGRCQDRENGFVCQCRPGFSGHTCQLTFDPCRHIRCQHGGRCIHPPGDVQALCRCGNAYTGSHCQNPLGACAVLRCLNNGTCISGLSGSFHCACADGYWGPLCQFHSEATFCTRNPCRNGGTCWSYSWGFRCTCFPGFHGDLCQDSGDRLDAVTAGCEPHLLPSQCSLSSVIVSFLVLALAS